MGTKQIRVSERLYARIQDERRDDETISETLERMVDGYGLREFAADVAEMETDWDTEALEASLEAGDARNRDQLEDELP